MSMEFNSVCVERYIHQNLGLFIMDSNLFLMDFKSTILWLIFLVDHPEM